MRVLLIKPPIRAFMHEIGRHTPIGLAYLSAVLRAAGHETVVFDALAYTEDNALVARDALTDVDRCKLASHPRWRHLVRWGAAPARIAALLREVNPDVVGISCMFSPYYETAYEVVRLARGILPRAHIVIGGQHPTVAPEHALAVREIDSAVLGEAEVTFPALLAALADGAPLDTVDGVAFRCHEGRCQCAAPEEGRLHIRRHDAWIEDLDALPFPAADQLDFSRYGNATTLITSRGCPYSCTFCTVHATVGRRFRARSPENVVDEIQRYVEEFGVRTFLIEDDNFTFDIDRVQRICREIVRRGIEVDLRLPNGITVVKLSPDVVKSMADAGFRHLFLGLETTDPARLRAIAKGFTSLQKVHAASAWFAAADINVSASLIVGLPGQQLPEIARDVANLLQSGLRFWSNPFYPIPGSPDFGKCLEAGLVHPTTDYALFDQYNFALGSDRLSHDEVYWLWVAVQAAAQWPGYVRGAAETPLTWADVAGALGELIAYAGSVPSHVLELPATLLDFRPVADGIEIRLRAETCFCAQHRLHTLPAGQSVSGLCALGGDAIAAALTLRTGQPVVADETACRLTGAEHCTFLLRPGPARPIEAALRTAILGTPEPASMTWALAPVLA